MLSLDAVDTGERESLWDLFRVVAAISALSWGGLAMMAQLQRHYVDHERRVDPRTFADLVALAWMVPGPVGCNVAIQLGQTLRGRAGAWIAGIASVLPFSLLMTLFAIFYQTPLIHTLAVPVMLRHFSMVLAALIAVTWVRQVRTLARAAVERGVAASATVLLALAHNPAAFVAILIAAFAAGWITSPEPGRRLRVVLRAREWRLLAALALLVGVFALPLPGDYETRLLWPRLAGAGMTLFGGGFSALPVLKTLFVTPGTGISERDFTLAFALSPVSPGPLLNVVPFLGYLTAGWRGALLATVALFVPSGCLVVFAQRHIRRLQHDPRFAHGMKTLRAATTAFLLVAVVRIVAKVPVEPVYWLTGAFAGLCFARFRLPVYAVYGAVALACGGWLLLTAR
jgi:chromate transporter